MDRPITITVSITIEHEDCFITGPDALFEYVQHTLENNWPSGSMFAVITIERMTDD